MCCCFPEFFVIMNVLAMCKRHAATRQLIAACTIIMHGSAAGDSCKETATGTAR
jgi:hypothetical protein